MTAKAKAVNYTAEQVASMVADYKAGIAEGVENSALVKTIAEKVGKGVRSVVAKLSREGVYKKAEYKAKDGSKAETKSEIVEKIAEKLDVPAETVGSLEAATKQALKLVEAAL